jgi:hypothetical protein
VIVWNAVAVQGVQIMHCQRTVHRDKQGHCRMCDPHTSPAHRALPALALERYVTQECNKKRRCCATGGVRLVESEGIRACAFCTHASLMHENSGPN